MVHVVEDDAGRYRRVLRQRAAQRAERRFGVGESDVEVHCVREPPRQVRRSHVGRATGQRDVDTAWTGDVVRERLPEQRRLAETRAGHQRDHTDLEAAPHELEETWSGQYRDASRRRRDHAKEPTPRSFLTSSTRPPARAT